MPRYQAISKTEFTNLRWQRHSNWLFAAADAVTPLVLQELPKAAMSLPIAFIKQDETFSPVAVQGLQPGQNLLVSADGRWVGPYTPASYRAYPFALATAENGELVLCVDVESGLVAEDKSERFFDESGEPSQAVKDVLNFLQQVADNRQRTLRACAVLEQEDLLKPWPIAIKKPDGEQTVEGLYCVDEAKFNNLDADALYRIHQADALPLIYCQLLSMQHLQTLAKLLEAHAQNKADALAKSTDALNLDFLKQNGTISFGPH